MTSLHRTLFFFFELVGRRLKSGQRHVVTSRDHDERMHVTCTVSIVTVEYIGCLLSAALNWRACIWLIVNLQPDDLAHRSVCRRRLCRHVAHTTSSDVYSNFLAFSLVIYLLVTHIRFTIYRMASDVLLIAFIHNTMRQTRPRLVSRTLKCTATVFIVCHRRIMHSDDGRALLRSLLAYKCHIRETFIHTVWEIAMIQRQNKRHILS